MIIPPAIQDERSFDPSKTSWSPVVVVIGVLLAMGWWLIRSRPSELHPRAPAAVTVVATLPPQVRAQLRPRMRRHAAAMTEMTDAVMAFDDRRAARAAAAVLEDPQLVQPLSSEAAALETELPPIFRDYEASLRIRAEALLAAAQSHDGERLTKANAELAWTCAQCHAAFAGP